MTVAAFTMALLEMAGHPRQESVRARIAAAAPVILDESSAAHVDPLVVGAIAIRESAMRQRARGLAGEIGLMQIHPKGMARHLCGDLLRRVHRLRENVRCGIRILLHARAKCGGGAPEMWLGPFNGRACGPNRYTRRVLALVALVTRQPSEAVQ